MIIKQLLNRYHADILYILNERLSQKDLIHEINSFLDIIKGFYLINY